MRRPTSTTCQVAGCTVDLTTLRSYFLRQKICEEHAKAASIPDGQGGCLRFCQQCTKLEPVGAFEGTKRSCRASLIKRHDRHRMHSSSKRGRRGSKYGRPSDSSSGSEDFEEESGHKSRRLRRRSTADPGSPRSTGSPRRGRSATPYRQQQQQQQQQQQLLASLGLGGGGGGFPDLSGLFGAASAAAPASGTLQMLLNSLGGSGATPLQLPPTLPPSSASPLAALFDSMCEQSAKAAASAAAAGAAAQALLTTQGGAGTDEALRLVHDAQMLQQLQSQVLQRLQALVQQSLAAQAGSPPMLPHLPHLPSLQRLHHQQQPGGGTAQLELLLSLLPTPPQVPQMLQQHLEQQQQLIDRQPSPTPTKPALLLAALRDPPAGDKAAGQLPRAASLPTLLQRSSADAPTSVSTLELALRMMSQQQAAQPGPWLGLPPLGSSPLAAAGSGARLQDLWGQLGGAMSAVQQAGHAQRQHSQQQQETSQQKQEQ